MSSAPRPGDSRVSIRPVQPQEAQLVLTFIRELADYEQLTHEVTATVEDLRVALFGAPPRAEAVFVRLDGVPAGFALWFYNFSTFRGRPGLYLEDLYVRPAMRGLGLGGRLLAWLARLALERGCSRFEWAVLDWNEPALRFYRNLGAQPAADWTIYRMTGEPLARLAARATTAE